MRTLLTLTCGMVLATAGFAKAQLTTTEVTTTTTPAVRRVSQILGSSVQLQGNVYGKVEDIVLDDNGSISYLVVGTGNQVVMMPWHAGTVNYGQRVVTYDVAPQALQPLLFERTVYPNVSDQQFITRMGRVFPARRVIRQDTIRTGGPGGTVVEETDVVKVKPNGRVIIKEKLRD